MGVDPFVVVGAPDIVHVAFSTDAKGTSVVITVQRPGQPDSVRAYQEGPGRCESLAGTAAASVAMAVGPLVSAVPPVSPAPSAAYSVQSAPTPAPVSRAAGEGVGASPVAPAGAAQQLRFYLQSDWPGTGLFEVVDSEYRTSLSTQFYGARGAGMGQVARRHLCQAPCELTLAPTGNYVVDAPGMQARGIYLPGGTDVVRARVTGAGQPLRTASIVTVGLGATTAVFGALMWSAMASNKREESAPQSTAIPQTIVFTGLGIAAIGAVGYVLSGRTHVDTPDGVRLDAHTQRPQPGLVVTPQGVML